VHSSATAAAQSHHEAMLQDTRVQMMKLWWAEAELLGTLVADVHLRVAAPHFLEAAEGSLTLRLGWAM
jgi:hypothetical protein